jgi:vancomycin resistance protein VanW
MDIIKSFKDYFSFTNYAKQLKKDLSIYSHEIFLQYKIINDPMLSVDQLINQVLWIQNTLNDIVIKPKQVFSFWKALGKPNHGLANKNSYNIYILYSSIIYHLSLVSGLSIIERHHFDIDLVAEHQRIYPLGADALVLYASKDLKIKNNFAFPIKLQFEVKDQFLKGYILSTKKIILNEVVFRCKDYKNFKEVLTRVNCRTTEVTLYKKKV